jgi:BirA family biotin operon repressor/biotin-[acetyl-CoA-carboxylase] ligase
MPACDALDPDRIQANLHTEWLGSQVVVFQSTASTNDVAAAYARDPQNHGLVVVAEQQTHGRGRGGNHWLSRPGDSILSSMVLIDSCLRPGLLTLTIAVATAEAIGVAARIKWPNDIYLRGRKVCGILVESKAYTAHTATVLGMGINCHQRRTDFPPALRHTATSLDLECGRCSDRVSLLRRLLVNIEQWLALAIRDESGVVSRWKEMSMQVGQRVTLVHDGRQYRGRCLGVDPEAGLILRLDRGGIQYFAAAQSHIVPC